MIEQTEIGKKKRGRDRHIPVKIRVRIDFLQSMLVVHMKRVFERESWIGAKTYISLYVFKWGDCIKT